MVYSRFIAMKLSCAKLYMAVKGMIEVTYMRVALRGWPVVETIRAVAIWKRTKRASSKPPIGLNPYRNSV